MHYTCIVYINISFVLKLNYYYIRIYNIKSHKYNAMLHYRKSKLNTLLVNKQKENSDGVCDQVNGRLYRRIHFNKL